MSTSNTQPRTLDHYYSKSTQHAQPTAKPKKRVRTPRAGAAQQQPEPAPSSLRWLTPVERTCLRAVHRAPLLPAPQPGAAPAPAKVAAFDLDGTLIRFGGFGTAGPVRIAWQSPLVPSRLSQLHADGYVIAIVSNQKRVGGGALLERFKLKVPLLARALGAAHFVLLAATADDRFRKPRAGMWAALARTLAEEFDGLQIDAANSFFVGDAAGRAGDHSAADSGFAAAVGLPFFTPEEYFV